jgi:serine/threonine protein kinase
MQGSLIANKYVVKEEIGRGRFGIIYKGEHVKHRTPIAIKMEPACSEYNTIKYESTILNYLYSNGCRVIPSVLWYGIYGDYKCLTMDYYDQTIEQYIQIVRNKHTGSPIHYLIQVIKLIANMVDIISKVHKHQIIHRDIKPENFMLKQGELFLIDFGIASSIISSDEPGREINRDPNRDTIIGSPKYISYFIHQGYEPMYRDDLVSIGYCFIYFALGYLPWANLSCLVSDNPTQDVYPEIHILHEKNQVRKKWKEWGNIEKIVTTLSKKQSGNHEPIFINIFEYFSLCYNLQLEEQPFYEELCQVLQKNL